MITRFFDINTVFFTILDYPVSYVEFIGTVSGLVSVWMAARSNIWTWPIGLINVAAFFLIFYQVQLYSDMFLQVYFFAMSIYGWIAWSRQNRSQENPIRFLSARERTGLIVLLIVSTALFGTLIKNIHSILPDVFVKPAAYPYLDTFIAAMSILATVFLARRILENWVLWITVDVLSVGLYFAKNVLLISIEYFIFLCLASFGFYNWYKKGEKV
ncbi:MAG: nicotinamide riboside transporter PnuC [Pyrinomonadaceae bacterium]